MPRSKASGLGRRTVLTAGGIAFAGLGLPRAAGAAEMTPAEKANVKIVNDFCAAWPGHNLDGVMSFFADACVYRVTETMEPNKGKQAVTDRIRIFLDYVEKFEVLDTFARGPMVINERRDHFSKGGPLKMWHGVGVFFLKDGKIVEWYDYTISMERA